MLLIGLFYDYIETKIADHPYIVNNESFSHFVYIPLLFPLYYRQISQSSCPYFITTYYYHY